MATYKIKTPDGHSYQISAPDNASQQQIESEVVRQFPESSKPRQSSATPSAVDSFSNKAIRYGKEAAYQFGSAAKNLGEGVVGGLGLITDTPARVYDAGASLFGGRPSPSYMKPAESFIKGMEDLGGPELQATTPTQRVIEDVQRGIGGAIGGLGVGKTLTTLASPVAKRIGQALSSVRGTLAPAVTSSLSSGITREAGGGPGAQLAAALAGGMVPAGGAAALKRMSGITPTADAQLLLNRGFDLTPGQLNKGGAFDQLETAFESTPLLGQIIKAPKNQVEADLRHTLIQESAAPNAVIPKSMQTSQMLEAAYHSFDPAYKSVHGFELVLQKGKPVIFNAGKNTPIEQELKIAIGDLDVTATDETRKIISKWITNQLTRPIKYSEDLLKIRSAIRSKIRDIKSTDNESSEKRDLYENAETVITRTLESQLPPKLLDRLKAVDAKYANYKTIEKSVFKGGDEFTMPQVERVMKQGTDESVYARGGGSPLRPLVEAGKSVTAQTIPQTGARTIPVALAIAAATKTPAAVIAGLLSAGLVGTKTGRTLARGGYGFQKTAAGRPLDDRTLQGLLEAEKAQRMADLMSRRNN